MNNFKKMISRDLIARDLMVQSRQGRSFFSHKLLEQHIEKIKKIVKKEHNYYVMLVNVMWCYVNVYKRR